MSARKDVALDNLRRHLEHQKLTPSISVPLFGTIDDFAMATFSVQFFRTIDDFAKATAAVLTPIGLTGRFTVTGLDHARASVRDGERQVIGYKVYRNGEVVKLLTEIPEGWTETPDRWLQWPNGQYGALPVFADSDDHAFDIDLTTEMTPLHVVRAAAAEYVRIHGEDRWHQFFEIMEVDLEKRVIHLSMGS